MEPREGKTPGTLKPEGVSTRLTRIAELARQKPQAALTTLAHHIDVDFLHEAYRLTRKDGAAGIDGQTAEDYERNLEGNLQSLLNRFKSGTYYAPPVRRVYIPKADGTKLRPIGIPTFEDKILQRAVGMVLEAVYEQEFLTCSYGFRPGRSAHDALDALWKSLMAVDGGAVLELDIEKFFDTLNHGDLRAMLDQRVRDGVLRRTVDKWLAAGVLEDGSVTRAKQGSPQGGVISPILSNIYLHEVLDRWFHEIVQPRLAGRARLIRYADDAVIVFAREEDARRVMEVLPKRFAKYGLKLHPEKTRLVSFRRPRDPKPPRGGPGAFDFLGFTHYWGTSRQGKPVVQRKTSKARFARALKSIGLWMSRHLHLRKQEQHAALSQKLRGHFGYFGITGNMRLLECFRYQVTRLWRRWLGQRSQDSLPSWDRLNQYLARFPFPRPRIVHSALRAAANP